MAKVVMKCPNCSKIAQVDDTRQIMRCNRCGAEITTLSRRSYVVTKPSEVKKEEAVEEKSAVQNVQPAMQNVQPVQEASFEEPIEEVEEEISAKARNSRSYQTKLPIEGDPKIYTLESYDSDNSEHR